MRLLELRLSAFGPFSDVTLDLTPAQPGLHIIYGGNEAGKSTALRALTGFFFGFPHVSADTHLHKKLRVGARLLGDDGVELDLVRKKGLKRTLVDISDRPVDDAPLRRLLGGVGPELFSTLFGLDHETLRSGADTLVRGKGHIGESLFEVGLGTAGLSDMLDDLRKQADAIYSPRARTRPLNEALKKCASSKQEIRRESVTAKAYQAQEQAIEAAREEAAEYEEQLRELTRRRHRLERATRTLPMLARRQQLLDRREALGEVRRLPRDTPRRRESARRVIVEATARLEEVEPKLAELIARREGLPVVEGPPDEDQERERLTSKLAAREQSAARIPTLQGELSRLEADAQTVLRGLGRGDSLDRAEALRIDTQTHARITKLALEAGPVSTRRGAAAHNASGLQSRVDELQSVWDALPAERDSAELAGARARALRAGDLDSRLRDAEEAATGGRHVVEDLAEALEVPRSQASDVARRAVPPADVVSRLARQHREHTSERSRIEGLLAASRERASEVSGALTALTAEGDVPSEADLDGARKARKVAFAAMLGSAEPLRPEHPLVRSFEKSVETADTTADRLRREADRVARKARLAADDGRLAASMASHAGELSSLDQDLEQHRQDLAELWQGVSVSPRSADDWLVWLGKHGEIVRAERASEALERTRAGLAELAEELGAAL